MVAAKSADGKLFYKELLKQRQAATRRGLIAQVEATTPL